jgi:hypothetical protein
LFDFEDEFLFVEVEERLEGIRVPVMEDRGDDISEFEIFAYGGLRAVDEVRMAERCVSWKLGVVVEVGRWGKIHDVGKDLAACFVGDVDLTEWLM